MPDYTKQLDEIVRLLSRPNIPPLLLAGVAALLGVIFGAIGRAIEQWIEGRRRRSRMRRVLYEGIAHNFCQVSIYAGEHANARVQGEAFSKLTHSIDFSGEDYIKHNIDIFVQLSEYRQARDMYDLLHRIINDGTGDMNNNCQHFMWTLGHYISENQLPSRKFRRYLGKKRANAVITRAREIHDAAARNWEGFQKQTGLSS